MSWLHVVLHVLAHWSIAGVLTLKKELYRKGDTLFDHQNWSLWLAPILITMMWIISKFFAWFLAPLLIPYIGQALGGTLAILGQLCLFGIIISFYKVFRYSYTSIGLFSDQLSLRLIIGFRWMAGFFFLMFGLLPYLAMLALGEAEVNQELFNRSVNESGIIKWRLEFFEETWGSYSLWIPIFISAVFMPVFEEFLFRGVLYGPIRQRVGPWPGMLITSFLFTLAHGSLHPYIFLLGVALAYLYEQTQSLIPGIIFHALINLIKIVSYLGYLDSAPQSFDESLASVKWTMLILGVLFIIFELIYRWMIKKGFTLKLPHSILQHT